jgi:cell division protein FtsA
MDNFTPKDDIQDIVVGLDIGTTKIAAIVGTRTANGKIEIKGIGKAESVGVMRGVVTHITPTIESIKKAIQDAIEKTGVDIKVVNVGIAGQHIKSLQHKGLRTRTNQDAEIGQDDIDALIEDMHKLVMLPGDAIIHVIPQEYIVDNEQGIRDPIGMAGVRLEANFHIISGQYTAIKNIKTCVERADLEITELILEPLASADAVIANEEKEAGVVLVDIGGGTTDVAIFHDGILRHTAVIPFGGNIITEDIKEGCTILRNQAELLKVKFGSALASENQENEIVSIPGLRGRAPKEISLKNLAHIIEARMEEIIEHVFYEIKTSGYEKKLVAGIVVTGGGSQLKHLQQLFEYTTGMTTRIGYPNEHLSGNNTDDISSPSLATGVGLVLKGFQFVDKQRRRDESNGITHEKKIEVNTGSQKVSGKGLFKSIFEIFNEDTK